MKKACLFLFVCLISGSAQQQNTVPGGATFGLHNQKFIVSLSSPLSTRNSKPGDSFVAKVESPDQFREGILHGQITSMQKPENGLGKGNAQILFQFDSLTYSGVTGLIEAQLDEVSNSKGVKNVDEEGRVISKNSNKKRVLATLGGIGAGALIGGLAGGGKGAAIGGAAGAVAGATVGVTMTSTSSNIEFLPGSRFTLTISDASSRKR